jgi:hypothetical protein
MSSVELRVESALMPDWNRRGADEINRIDWQPIADLGKLSEPASRAPHTKEA